MKLIRYKERYNLTPNYLGVRFSRDTLFVDELYSKPKRVLYNIGVWIIKYKANE